MSAVVAVRDRLIALPADELADVFMFPVLGDGQRQWVHYGCTREVNWGRRRREFYVRSAAVPFNIVPLRPSESSKDSPYFSLGPGLDRRGNVRTVLLVQCDGDRAVADEIIEAALEAVSPWTTDVEHHVERVAPQVYRCCIAGIVRTGDV